MIPLADFGQQKSNHNKYGGETSSGHIQCTSNAVHTVVHFPHVAFPFKKAIHEVFHYWGGVNGNSNCALDDTYRNQI